MKVTGGAIIVGLVVLAVAGAAGYVYLQRRKIGQSVSDAVSAAVDAVNPASDQNVAYKAANAVTQAITGDSGTTLGNKLFELFNPSAVAAEKAALAPIETKQPNASAIQSWAADLSAIDANDADLGLALRGAYEFATTPGGAATGRPFLH